jgi:hypothetical protein
MSLVRFLPSDSPYLDGIEYFFNPWKNIVRRARLTNDEGLLVAIACIHAHGTEEQCKSYFRHIVHNCENLLAGKLNANYLQSFSATFPDFRSNFL